MEWPGKLAATIFLPGCNLRCPYCHNRDLVLNPDNLPNVSWRYIVCQLCMKEEWIEGVSITGGEPTLYPHLIELIQELRSWGLEIKIDTNGTRPDVLQELIHLELVECIAMDVKGNPSNSYHYQQCCGCGVDIDHIRDSIKLIIDGGISHIFRTTVVPYMHTVEHIKAISEYLKSAQCYKIQNFRANNTLDPACMNIKPFSPQEMEKFRKYEI